jgi:hypothetical protein
MARPYVNKTVLLVLHLFTAVALILGGVCAAIYLADIWSNDRWKIRTGHPTKKVGINVNYLVNIMLLIIAVACFGMAVLEVLLCIPQVARTVDGLREGFVRPVIYLLLGILVMGCAASLGIAAAACILLATAIWGFLAILNKC